MISYRVQSARPFRFPMIGILLVLLSISIAGAPADAPVGTRTDSTKTEQGYRIDQPGTITFTVGVKISGKVEKPQVMIFLPKEKTLYREEVLTRSFSEELAQPLPFTPVIE